MRRILILGCSGSGKSTFARRLRELTGLPLVHLDQLYWQPGWKEPSREHWLALLQREIEAETWIMDGHMGDSIPLRLRSADAAFFFDFPRRICLRRAALRVCKGYGEVRRDMAAGCPERIDLAFVKFIWEFRRERRPAVLEALRAFPGELIVFRTPRDVKRYLRKLEAGETRTHLNAYGVREIRSAAH